MRLNNINEKKAAIELSIGTIVVIVLAMTMLILGIVLVRNIFTFGIDSTDTLNDKVQDQITALFTEEQSNVVVRLGSDKTAKIRAGDLFNVNFGARLSEGGALTRREDLIYTLKADKNSRDNCMDNPSIGENKVEKFFKYDFDSTINFDRTDGKSVFGTIEISIPDGTPSCTQKIFIDVKDNRAGSVSSPVGSDYFIIEVTQGGIFS